MVSSETDLLDFLRQVSEFGNDVVDLCKRC